MFQNQLFHIYVDDRAHNLVPGSNCTLRAEICYVLPSLELSKLFIILRHSYAGLVTYFSRI